MKKLTVHIMIFQRDSLANKENIFVAIEGISRIRRFRNILSNQTNERAMFFALSKGRVIERPRKLNRSSHLILTKDSSHWDLM